MEEHMLTTVDNPFDPFTQFNEWNVWDQTHGYFTLAYLGRIVRSSDALSEADQALAEEQALDEIVSENIGLYKKVLKPVAVMSED